MICRGELRGLAERYADLQASRVEVVAVGPQTPAEGKAMGLPFPVLSDPKLEIAAAYGLLHPKGRMGKDVPRPATLLLDQGSRKILWMRATDNVRIRPEVDELFEILRR